MKKNRLNAFEGIVLNSKKMSKEEKPRVIPTVKPTDRVNLNEELNPFQGIVILLLMSLTVIAFIGLITIVLMENK